MIVLLKACAESTASFEYRPLRKEQQLYARIGRQSHSPRLVRRLREGHAATAQRRTRKGERKTDARAGYGPAISVRAAPSLACRFAPAGAGSCRRLSALVGSCRIVHKFCGGVCG